jgi:hypothetical protein
MRAALRLSARTAVDLCFASVPARSPVRRSLPVALPGVREESCNPSGREEPHHDPSRLHTGCGMTLVPCIVPRGGDHCDFCCTPPVIKVYRCSNFALNGQAVFPNGLPMGSWAACRKCAELVDERKWADLTDRALRKFAKRHGVSRRELVAVRAQFAEISQP